MARTPIAKSKRERRHEARPDGVETFAATAWTLEEEHEGRVLAAPRDTVLARFKPNTSPSSPARKLLAILMHRAGVLWAAGEWPENNTLEFCKADLRTSGHQGTDRLEDVLTEVGGIRLMTPTMMRDGHLGTSYTAVSPRFHIAEAGEGGAPVVIELAPEIVDLVKRERSYARLDVPILLGLEGKFAVTLYQIGQLVLNIPKRPYDEIPISDIRERLGLRKGEYDRPNDVLRLLERAAGEVSQLSPTFNLRVEPVKRTATATRGRSAAIRAFRIYAVEKTARASLAAHAELQASRVGRAARRHGKAEQVAGVAADAVADRRRLASARLEGMASRGTALTQDAVAKAERLEAGRTKRLATPKASEAAKSGGDPWAELNAAFKRKSSAVDVGST